MKYWLAGSSAALVAAFITMGALSSAQTVAPLTCTILGSSSVVPGASATLVATGGNGQYSWTGQNLATTTNATGNEFIVTYPTAGTYGVTVSDTGGNRSTCNVMVSVPNTTTVAAGANATGTLTCAPAMQTVTLGQTASVTASGGDGSYTWSSPDLRLINPYGTGFNASYASVGSKIITVTSAGLTANCEVNVLPVTTLPAPTPTPTPGLPNTGGGYGR